MEYNSVSSFRDLTLLSTGKDGFLVIACDSLGGIGSKPHDRVNAPGEILGRFTVRVPLMEVMAAGAHPLLIVNTLCVEMEPTGKEILAGIRKEAESAGLAGENVITGSTEENVVTCQSAFGVTVIARASRDELRLGKSREGDVIACVGVPKVGDEVLDADPKADLPLVQKLLTLPWVHEILPVGSRGVGYEAELLARGAGRNLTLLPEPVIELKKSAGPGTCLLVTLAENDLELLKKTVQLPVHKVGCLK